MHVKTALLLSCALALAGRPALSQQPKEPTPSPAPAAKTVMMWHLSPIEGATPELAARIEKALRARFQQLHGAELMDGMTMDSLLLVEGNEKFLRCGTGAGCLAGLGKLAGMKYVITGEVARTDGRTSTRLALVDVARKQVVLRAAVDSAGLPSQAQMDELAVAMFSPERYTGSIDLSVPVAGAEVFVDGQPKGVTPLPGPLADLTAGEHLVEVKKAGHQPFSRTVRIPLHKSVRLVALLPPLVTAEAPARPFYKDWPFWTALGVGVAAMAVAGGLHYDAGVLQDNADRLRDQHLEGAAAEQDRADARSLQAYVMYGVGGAGLLAAGLIAIIDVASGDHSGGRPAGEPGRSGLQIGPGPGGLGLSAGFRF